MDYSREGRHDWSYRLEGPSHPGEGKISRRWMRYQPYQSYIIAIEYPYASGYIKDLYNVVLCRGLPGS